MQKPPKLLTTAPLNWRDIPRSERPTVLSWGALAWKQDAFTIISKAVNPPVSRQQVSGVAYGERQSKRIEKALRMAIARRRYP